MLINSIIEIITNGFLLSIFVSSRLIFTKIQQNNLIIYINHIFYVNIRFLTILNAIYYVEVIIFDIILLAE